MKVTPTLLVLVACLALAGCVTTGGGSVAGGECKVFDAPPYAIRGATQHDQDWIDPTIESGVGACGWARPAPRPAEWDAVQAVPRKPAKVAAKKKKHGWIWKEIPKLAKKPAEPAAAPVADAEPVAEAAPAAPPVSPAPPRSALDVLLHPELP